MQAVHDKSIANITIKNYDHGFQSLYGKKKGKMWKQWQILFY